MELRASRLPLLTKCTGPLYLPNEEYESENARKGSEWGKMVHHWKETGEIRGPTKRDETALEKAIRVSGISREELWPRDGTHEQGIGLRIDGARQARIAGASPLPQDGWLTGTDDFQWWLFDELWIDDLKTGRAYPDPRTRINRFPQDVRSTQLRAYALAVATVLNYHGITHVSLTHWPRLPLANRLRAPERFWTSYTRTELDDFWEDLERIWREREAGLRGEYTLNPGDHCRFCPSRKFCLEAKDFSKEKR